MTDPEEVAHDGATHTMARLTINKPRRAPLLLEAEALTLPSVAPDTAVPSVGGNVQEVTVSELSNALKRTVEDRFGFVRLRGEISNYRGPHSSGHAYFCLKDEGARIDAVVWRTALARMRVKPEEGMEVVASGKITTFPGKSSYQIVVESLEPAGLGALMAVLEERRRKLAAEGLFDVARKRLLPFLPGIIGVVTSPTGAVIRDILHRVGARFPRHVVVWPVRVQGDTSAGEVAAAIRGLNDLLDHADPRRPHLIIVARGGGSLEDLWGYNDEAVVRAVAESLIPLISAVGHETDWTLIDHVADLRAPTPTGAAEMALPVLADLFATVTQLRGRQASAALRRLERDGAAFRALARHLPSGAALMAIPRQRLDRAASELPRVARAGPDRTRLALARLANRLGARSPRASLARDKQRLADTTNRLARIRHEADIRGRERLVVLKDRLGRAYAGRLQLARVESSHRRELLIRLVARLGRARDLRLDRSREQLAASAQMLAGLSYKSVLARGFALVRNSGGEALRSVAGVREARLFTLEMQDGTVVASVGEGPHAEPASDAAARPSARRKARGGEEGPKTQGSLF